MQAKYGVFARAMEGTLIERVSDFVTLHILMTLNGVGSWSIKSRTKEPCPFEPGMGIIVVRDSEFLYGGIVEKIQDVLDAKTSLYTWGVSGVGDLGYLNRRVCYVDPITGSTTIAGHYTDSGELSSVVNRLIDRNVGENALESRREPIIRSNSVTPFGGQASVYLRFQNLLSAVVSTCRKNGYNIRANWDKNNSKVFYELFTGTNLSQDIIFTEQLNNITNSEFIAKAPEGNSLIAGGKGEMTEREFAYADNATSIDQGGRIEKFVDARNQDGLEDYVNGKLDEKSENVIGYSCTASDSDNAPQFGKDYNLGDIISMKVGTTYIAAEVQQVEIEVSGGRETISPKFGTVAIGKFREIFAKLTSIREDVDELLGTEIE